MDLVSDSISSVKYTIKDFSTFLSQNKILELGIAFIVSTQINQLASKFIDNIVSPVIHKIINQEENSLKDVKMEIFGIKFEIGDFIVSFLKFLTLMIILFYVVKVIK